MKKVSPDNLPPQDNAANNSAVLADIVPIRTETALTHYPLHCLAKKSKLPIRQIAQNKNGKTISTWEVVHPPGSLGYKIDALIINRRIDELRNTSGIRSLIKLGSLREICAELGISPEGKNTLLVKEALYQNAQAFIKAKLDYKGSDGTQYNFEFGTSRYAVILTGETLPNGRTADAVYIRLHEDYCNLLLRAQTRPLDYTYLQKLPPAAHRLYELLSFAMFGALKHGRPNAQMRYSDFCRNAPLTRYEDWNKVRPQMWKIHQSHIANEYFEEVAFVETVDEEGKPDWLMKYTPGRRAKIEFATFTAKQQKQEHEPALRLAPKPADPKPAASPPLSEEEQALVAQLTAYKITARKARKLVLEHRAAVERELQAFPYRDKSSIKSAAAWLIRAIESGDYSAPSQPAARAPQQPLTPQQQEQEAETRAAAEREQEACDRRNTFELAAQKRYQELSPAQLQQRQAQAEAAYANAAKVADFRRQGIWDIVLRSLVVEQLTAELAAGDRQHAR